MIIDI